MKSQTLAVSVVLLLMAVATLPGLSFSLSSSVTSYNNNSLYNTGDIENIKSETEGVEFDIIDVSDDFGNEAYEIASSSGSFGTGKVSFNIPGSKTFIVNVKIDNYYTLSPSGFNLSVSYVNTEGQNETITAKNIYGGSVSSFPPGQSAQGYLCPPGTGNNENWHLEKGTTHAEKFNSNNGDVSVTVFGTEDRSKIHFYIIFIKDQEAGT